MGCVQSVGHKKRQIAPANADIFSSVRAVIDQSPTFVDESSPFVLRYRTPHFRAHAQVIFPPIHKKEVWTVGWIQACDYMKFTNQYGGLGYSSWEIPELNSRKISAVSDSDGVSYPWYGNTTEIATVVGPTESFTRMHLTMNDNFYPSVTWDIPVSEGTSAHLTHIVRDQSFFTWLAAINETTKEIVVLNTVRWEFYLEIYIDPTKEAGHRTLFMTPRFQKQPEIMNGLNGKQHPMRSSALHYRLSNKKNKKSRHKAVGRIPVSALVRPSANYAQTLVWRPSEGQSVVIVPPKETPQEKNEVILYNNLPALDEAQVV